MCSAHTPLLTFTFCFCSLFYSCARVSHSLLRVPSVVLRLFSLACIGFFPPFPGDSVHTTPSPVSLPPLPSPLRIRLPKRHIVLSPSQSIPLSSARCSLSLVFRLFFLSKLQVFYSAVFSVVSFFLSLCGHLQGCVASVTCVNRETKKFTVLPPHSLWPVLPLPLSACVGVVVAVLSPVQFCSSPSRRLDSVASLFLWIFPYSRSPSRLFVSPLESAVCWFACWAPRSSFLYLFSIAFSDE